MNLQNWIHQLLKILYYFFITKWIIYIINKIINNGLIFYKIVNEHI